MKNDQEFLNHFQRASNQPPKQVKQLKVVKGANGQQLLVLPENDVRKVIKFLEENRSFVYNFITPLLQKGVDENWSTIEYFTVGNSGYTLKIDKSDLEHALTMMRDHYIETEEYEKAVIATSLLDRHRANLLMDMV